MWPRAAYVSSCPVHHELAGSLPVPVGNGSVQVDEVLQILQVEKTSCLKVSCSEQKRCTGDREEEEEEKEKEYRVNRLDRLPL